MSDTPQQNKPSTPELNSVNNDWGARPEDNYGYSSEEERRSNRGLEDWELLDKMSEPQPGVFPWLKTVIGSVIVGVVLFLTFAYGLNYVIHHFGMRMLGGGHN